VGFTHETKKTATLTIIQLAVDEGQRGRVMGTVFMIGQLAAAIGTYLIGAVAARAGLLMPIMVGAVLSVGIWAVFYVRRDRLFQKSTSITADPHPVSVDK